MTQEEAFYIFNFYSHLLPQKEKLLFSHNTKGVESVNMDAWNKRVELYLRNSSHKSDPEIAGFVNLWYEAFIAKCAEWLLKNHPDKVIIARCSKCNGLLRTPWAKQCPRCFYNWH